MVVLNGTRFDVTPTDVLLVEDNNIASRPLDRRMAQKGFLKAAQLPIDSVYVARRRDARAGARADDVSLLGRSSNLLATKG
mgnify:CR=1 FL=1